MDAYNQVLNGFVSSVQGIVICDHFLVLGKVLHSQKLRDKQLECWAISNKDGTVGESLREALVGEPLRVARVSESLRVALFGDWLVLVILSEWLGR